MSDEATPGTRSTSIREYVTDAIVYHPSNSRTGLPETRRPACAGLAGIAVKAVREEPPMTEMTEDTYPAALTVLTTLTRAMLQLAEKVDIPEMRRIVARFETIAPIIEPTAYQSGGGLNLRDQDALLAALDRFITDVRKLDRSESSR
jgi:hypothetical protein